MVTKIKKLMSDIAEKRQVQEHGKGTITCKTDAELEKVFEKFEAQLVSPGAAAEMLRVSRAYIHNLEKDGKIRAYRLSKDDIHWDNYSLWMKLAVAPKDEFIYIPVEDIEKIRKEMIIKAEKKLKRLKGKE